MKKITCLAVVAIILLFLSGCGTDELTPQDAEKAIRSDEPWAKNHEFRILEGDFVPKTVAYNKDKLLKKSYLPLYDFLKKAGYLNIDRIYWNKKHGPSGERYLTDIYKITATEKLKALTKETTKGTCEYGVYPPGKDVWQNKETSYFLHKVEMKLIDYRFVKINSIEDLRQDSSASNVCDIIVNFSYEKKFTALGKVVGEYPGGRSFGSNPKTDSVIESNACLQRSDDGWKVDKNFDSM
jgi:hypothetical protein